MSWLTLSDIAEMCGGQLFNAAGEQWIDSVSTDSRTVNTDQLFIAIKGDRFDAHDFVVDLVGKAAAALVDRKIDCDLPQIVVEDTKLALAAFAKAWRKRYTKPVLGLTGSNGKTTVKEMTAAILSQRGNTLSTLGNLNNDIGMPLSLLRIREEHDFAVIEMGTNHFGEIAFLVDVCQPDVAVINNAGPAHLDGFGDVAGVAKAKGEIFEGLADKSIAVINADDVYADYWRGLNQHRKVVEFGIQNAADVHGDYQGAELTIHHGAESTTITLPLMGRHNAMNALAAASLALSVGTTLGQVKQGLESMPSVNGRLNKIIGIKGSILIDDTYNANPASAMAGIDVLNAIDGKRIYVLGDMGELGAEADEHHAKVGSYAREMNIDQMYCLGDLSRHTSRAFGEQASHFDDVDMLINQLKTSIENSDQDGIAILVKGSRFMKMERVVEALRQS